MEKIDWNNLKGDKLDKIFYLQNTFDEFVARERNLVAISSEEWIQKQIIATMSELAELAEEVNFKWWKKQKPVDNDKVKDELIDVIHFVIAMCIKAGLTAEETCKRYIRKNMENYDRQMGKSEKKGYEV